MALSLGVHMSDNTPLAFVSAYTQKKFSPGRWGSALLKRDLRDDPKMPARNRVERIVAALWPNAPPKCMRVNIEYVERNTMRCVDHLYKLTVRFCA